MNLKRRLKGKSTLHLLQFLKRRKSGSLEPTAGISLILQCIFYRIGAMANGAMQPAEEPRAMTGT